MFGLLALALGAPGLGAVPERAVNSCAVCHSGIAKDYATSAHAGAEITCVDCHGGDPRDMEYTAMSGRVGFRGAPRRTRVPAFCAACHSDPGRMGRSGPPTDQYDAYRSGPHGLAVARGDPAAAVCTDCHGSHANLRAEDVEASVSPKRQPAMCGRCHSDRDLMQPRNRPSDVVREFERSVHGVALLEHSTPDAPSCTSCHGSHGAAPPGLARVRDACGECHGDARAAVARSPHARPAAFGRMELCGDCHAHHGTRPASVELFAAVCGQCHRPDGAAGQLARALQATISDAQALFDRATELVGASGDRSLSTDLAPELGAANRALRGAKQAQHTSRLADVERETRIVKRKAALMLERAGAASGARARRLRAVVAVSLSVLVIVGGIQLSRWLLTRRQATDGGGGP